MVPHAEFGGFGSRSRIDYHWSPANPWEGMQSQIDPRWLLRWHWQAGRGPQPEASGRTLRTVEKKRTLVIDTLHVWRNIFIIFEFWHGTTWPTFRSAARQQIKIKLCFIFQQFQRICSTQRIQTATNSLQFPFFILKVKGHKISNQNVGIGVPDRESVGNWDQHPHGSLVKSCKDTMQPLRIAVSFVCGMACSSVSTVLNNVRKTGKGKWTQSVTLWDKPPDRWSCALCVEVAAQDSSGSEEQVFRTTVVHNNVVDYCCPETLQRRRYGSCSRTVVENDEPKRRQSVKCFMARSQQHSPLWKRRMLLWPSHETFHRLPPWGIWEIPEGIWGVPEGQGGEGQGPNQPQESEDRQWVKASTKSGAGRMIKDGD